MPLDNFFHEVAFHRMNAERNQPPPPATWWQRLLRSFSPRTVRLITVAGLIIATSVVGLWRSPLTQWLCAQPTHPAGAADALAVVARANTPLERTHHLALACAREADAAGCREALRQAVRMGDPAIIMSWLREPDIHALRVNAFFNSFAVELEHKHGSARAPARE